MKSFGVKSLLWSSFQSLPSMDLVIITLCCGMIESNVTHSSVRNRRILENITPFPMKN